MVECWKEMIQLRFASLFLTILCSISSNPIQMDSHWIVSQHPSCSHILHRGEPSYNSPTKTYSRPLWEITVHEHNGQRSSTPTTTLAHAFSTLTIRLCILQILCPILRSAWEDIARIRSRIFGRRSVRSVKRMRKTRRRVGTKLESLGQSEPAPMTAPVGRSVHRMGCLFSSRSWPSVNQHRTTVNFFWLLTFGFFLPFSWPFFLQPWPQYYPLT
jgi:hypothetical protein